MMNHGLRQVVPVMCQCNLGSSAGLSAFLKDPPPFHTPGLFQAQALLLCDCFHRAGIQKKRHSPGRTELLRKPGVLIRFPVPQIVMHMDCLHTKSALFRKLQQQLQQQYRIRSAGKSRQNRIPRNDHLISADKLRHSVNYHRYSSFVFRKPLRRWHGTARSITFSRSGLREPSYHLLPESLPGAERVPAAHGQTPSAPGRKFSESAPS